MTVPTRLEQLQRLRDRIDAEITSEEAFLARAARLTAQAKLVITSRGDWASRVIACAAAHYGVDSDTLLGPTRGDVATTNARHVAAWLLRQDGRSYPQIAEALHRDHSTVMYSVKRAERTPELLAVAITIRTELVGEEATA